MVMNGEEGLECEVYVAGVCIEHILEFKYLGCGLDEAGTNGAGSRNVTSVRMVAGAIRSLVNVRDLQISVLEYSMKHCLYLFLRMAVRQC